MPWDSDVDVQVTEATMYYLAAYYNMSVFHYNTPRIPDGRDYMLEINPHYINRERADRLNVIDARWIDTETGLFIDITTARYNISHPEGEGMMSCKDGHEFRVFLCPRSRPHRDMQLTFGRIHISSLCETPFSKECQPRFHTATRTSWPPSTERNLSPRLSTASELTLLENLRAGGFKC